MPDQGYYTRVRGRVTGPYDLADLQWMVLRGALLRVHEVSADKENWVLAGTIEQLFPSNPPQRPGPTAVPETTAQETAPSEEDAAGSEAVDKPDAARDYVPQAAAERPDQEPADPLTKESYCYCSDGRTVGPVSLALLQMLALTGKLRPDDAVWQVSDGILTPARRFGPLSSVVPAGWASAGMGTTQATPRKSGPDFDGNSTWIVRQVSKLNLAGGLSAAALMLFCVNVPHARISDRLAFWWHLFDYPGMGMVILLCFYLLLASLSLPFVAVLLKGPIRGWTYIGAAAVGIPLLIATGMSVGGGSPLFLAILVPAICSVLACAALARLVAPQAQCTRIIQVSGGVLDCLITLAVMVIGTLALLNLSEGEAVPGWVVLVVALSILGYLCGLTCGVFAIMGARPTISKPLTYATVGLASVVMAMIMIAGTIIGHGIIDILPEESSGSRLVFVQVLRLMVVAAALIGLLVIGLFELLMCACRTRRPTRQGPGPA